MKPRQPLAVFDIGSTLVEGPAQGPAGRIAKSLGLGSAEKKRIHRALMSTAFTGPDDVAAFISATFAVAEAGPVVKEIWQAQESEAVLIPGVTEALELLRTHGYRFAVVSDIWPPFLTAVRARLGAFLDEYVSPQCRVFSFEQGRAKPDLELYRQVLRGAGNAPEEAVMIGDSYRKDIQPAQQIGMATVWLLHRAGGEAASIAAVLNGKASRPTLALRSIADLDVEQLSVLRQSSRDEA